MKSLTITTKSLAIQRRKIENRGETKQEKQDNVARAYYINWD